MATVEQMQSAATAMHRLTGQLTQRSEALSVLEVLREPNFAAPLPNEEQRIELVTGGPTVQQWAPGAICGERLD